MGVQKHKSSTRISKYQKHLRPLPRPPRQNMGWNRQLRHRRLQRKTMESIQPHKRSERRTHLQHPMLSLQRRHRHRSQRRSRRVYAKKEAVDSYFQMERTSGDTGSIRRILAGGGTLWVGFQCGGIASAEPRTLYRTWKSVQTKWYFNDNKTLRSPPAANGPELPCNLINTIYPLDNKRIVCGTVQGLGITLDGNRWSFRRGADYPDKIKGLYDVSPNGWTPPSNTEIATLLPEDYITAFESTPDGLWIGFRQKGAVLTDPNNDFIKKADYPFNVKKTSGTWVTDFLSIENGTMLVSTYGEGLNAVPGNGYIKQSSPMSKEIPFPENTSLLTEKEIQTLKTQLKNLDPLPKEKPWAIALYEDWTTRGNWCERYGQRKVMMCAVHMPVTQRTFGFDQKYQIWGDIGKHRLNNDRLRHWIHWVNKPSDTNILFEPSCHIRQEAEWDDHAEEYKRTWNGQMYGHTPPS